MCVMEYWIISKLRERVIDSGKAPYKNNYYFLALDRAHKKTLFQPHDGCRPPSNLRKGTSKISK